MKTVENISDAVAAMEDMRELPRALMGGTKAMRAKGKSYLPKEPGEDESGYSARLARTSLFNGFKKAVGDMSGKVFAREIAFGDDMDATLQEYAENIDLAGQNINVFAKGAFDLALSEGIVYFLVDMAPPVTDEAGNVVRLNRAQAAGRRPWAAIIRPEQVLGWKTANVNGEEILTQFRFMEAVTEDDGPYGEKSVEQIRVFIREGNAVRWETHRRQGQSKEWGIHEVGSLTIDEIPIVPSYTIRTGFMAAEPPLLPLAEVNLTHWQSQSDQRNILHVARVPILFGAGFANDDTMVVGAGTMATSSDPNAKLMYVEHSGAAIESGRQDLKDLEFQMQTLGLELLTETAKTATGERRDEDKVMSPLAMYALSLKDALENVFVLFAKYMGMDNAGSLVINTDFGITSRDATDITNILTAARDKIISRETALRELLRRGFLADLEPEEELDRIDGEDFGDEENDLGAMGQFNPAIRA